jgi:hypothetical protein
MTGNGRASDSEAADWSPVSLGVDATRQGQADEFRRQATVLARLWVPARRKWCRLLLQDSVEQVLAETLGEGDNGENGGLA